MLRKIKENTFFSLYLLYVFIEKKKKEHKMDLCGLNPRCSRVSCPSFIAGVITD